MKHYFYVLMILLSWSIKAQDPVFENQDLTLPKVISPSPTVANLMQFEEVPIDYYSGQAQITIPIFSKAVHKELSVNLSLNYNTQGIKINNRSGWIGTGWSLFAGGTISRTVRGIADETFHDWGSNRIGVMHNPDFWDFENLSPTEKEELKWNTRGTLLERLDSELDLYQFQFFGYSGRFVIVKEGGIFVPKLMTKDHQFKIEMTYERNESNKIIGISSFFVIDNKGYKYYFDAIEQTSSTSSSSFIPQGHQSLGVELSDASNNFTRNNTAWHLTRVTTSNDKELVTFEYESRSENYMVSSVRTKNTVRHDSGQVSREELSDSHYNQKILKPKLSISELNTQVNTKKLNKINFLDGVSIEFSLGGNHPETNGTILEGISILDSQGNENKRYDFTYEETARLWLTKVSEVAQSRNYDYKLTYHNKEALPFAFTSSSPWGYLTSNPYSPETIKTGLLKDITYPTGGIKEFEFEEHTFSFEGDRALTTEEYYDNPENLYYEGYSNNFTAPINVDPSPRRPVFTINFAQEVEIRVTSLQHFDSEKDKLRIYLTKTTSPHEGNSVLLTNNETKYIRLEPGDYRVYTEHVPFAIEAGVPEATGHLNIRYKEINTTNFFNYLKGGGVRIKEIRFKDNPTAAVSRRFSYDYGEPNSINSSSGSIDAKLGTILRKYTQHSNVFIYGVLDDLGREIRPIKQVRAVYDIESEGHIAPELTKGGYVGYKTIKVSETGNGYTQYTYTSPRDYPTPLSSFEYPFLPVPNLDYKRGLLLEEELYDEASRVLRATSNTYEFFEEFIAKSYRLYDQESCAWTQFYDTYEQYILGTPIKNHRDHPLCGDRCRAIHVYQNCGTTGTGLEFLVDNIRQGSNRIKTTNTKHYVYDDEDQHAIQNRDIVYTYNAFNYLPESIKTTIQEGTENNTYEQKLYYAVGGYPNTNYSGEEQLAINKMRFLNKTYEPVYTEQYKNEELINSIQKTYIETYPDLINLKAIHTQKGDLTMDKRINYQSYDEYGNILEVSLTEGAPVVYVWGYNEQLPILKIENSSQEALSDEVKTLLEELQEISNNSNTIASEALLKTKYNELRNHSDLKNALITGYTYDPVKGITSMIDAKGYITSYDYDEFNRLKYVKDHQNRIISKNEYHYKNE